ncbi:unnamed protein product [Prunus armeniaca]
MLHPKSIHVVKVLWRSQTVEEATWEPEAQMWVKGVDCKLSLPGIDSAVARYCPLWAPLSDLKVLFLGTHEQLPSGSLILGLL